MSRGGHRRKSSSAPSSCSPTSYPMVQILDTPGLLGGIRWWRCCGSSTCRLSSRSSQCPRTLWTGESDELADEPGGALDPALADLQRWRRELRRGDGGERGEAAVTVLSRLTSGGGQLWRSTVALLW